MTTITRRRPGHNVRRPSGSTTTKKGKSTSTKSPRALEIHVSETISLADRVKVRVERLRALGGIEDVYHPGPSEGC